MRKIRCSVAAVSLAAALSWGAAAAAVELPSIFGSHMVIQRDVKVPVWGLGPAAAEITVEFGGQTKSATVGSDGKWKVVLDPMKASSTGQTMTVTESTGSQATSATPPRRLLSSVKFDDVLIGDNWICSGQSNMEFGLDGTTNSQQERDDVVNHPNIRFYRVTDHISKDEPQDNCPGSWNTLTPDSARPLTAVGYFFGRRLNKELNIPIGLIQSAWGGTPIEPWTTYAGWEKNYVKQVADWLPLANAAVDKGMSMPPMPEMPANKANGGIYNGMIAPLAPYAIKGAIWYQGEANGGEGVSYFYKMQDLIGGWRKVFGVGDFGFYFVQLANWQNPNPNPEGGDGWAKVREAQRKALEIPNTGMAVAIDMADAGNPGDIHPKNKQDVGWRLAQWALYQTYGKKKLVPSGPLFRSVAASGNKLTVAFDWVGSGLIVGEKKGLDPVKEIVGGKLKGFAIAGADRKWVWADAVIDGKTVVLSSPEVPNPVAARYAFSMNPDTANLYNKEGMPASPFRSDDW